VTASDSIRHEIVVPVTLDHAFEVFTAHIGDWWPRENTFARVRGNQNALETIRIEPVEGGRWYERDITGDQFSWGSVLDWDPPHRIALGWQITPKGLPEPDAGKASEVIVRFTRAGDDATLVQIEHREFDRHGPEGVTVWRAAMDSPDGWPKFLQRFAQFVAGE
jgi:uncharacterized protein YndB with AHSA1/START domain